MEKTVKVNVKSLIVCALCCALTCVCAMFTIPIGVIPITLANLAVYISGALLGPIYGSLSQILYLALVFVGFPFTSKFVGGPTYFVTPTAGYMIGYVTMAFLTGLVYKFFSNKTKSEMVKTFWIFVGAILGTLSCYFLGTLWFSIQSQTDFFKAFGICVYPFLIGDFLKIVVTSLIIPRIENIIKV